MPWAKSKRLTVELDRLFPTPGGMLLPRSIDQYGRFVIHFRPPIDVGLRSLLADLLGALESLADPEDVAIRMAHVHFPDVPRFVGRRIGDLEALLQTMLMDRIDVVDPDRHPHSLVRHFTTILCCREIALAAPALAALAQEDLALAGANASERGGTTPVPSLLPAKLLKPGEGLLDITDIQDRREASRVHAQYPFDVLDVVRAPLNGSINRQSIG